VQDARSHFPKELLKQVKAGLNQWGFHVLGRNELHEICGFGLSGFEKLRLVHQFARQCDAECEIGLDFAAAQFLPKRIHPQMVRLLCIADLEGVTVTDGDGCRGERRPPVPATRRRRSARQPAHVIDECS
jgi:hypothetical protein